MSKRQFQLDRSRAKRVCNCGGELIFKYINGYLLPVTKCTSCGKEHIGLDGTKRVSE